MCIIVSSVVFSKKIWYANATFSNAGMIKSYENEINPNEQQDNHLVIATNSISYDIQQRRNLKQSLFQMFYIRVGIIYSQVCGEISRFIQATARTAAGGKLDGIATYLGWRRRWRTVEMHEGAHKVNCSHSAWSAPFELEM